MKTWLKGGLIGIVISFILWFLARFFGLFSFILSPSLYLFNLIFTLQGGKVYTVHILIITLLLWFFIGVIIGLIIGKIKEKKHELNKRK